MPRRLLEGGHPSAAGDWWGWAALLAFAGTGRPPFGGGAALAALARARSGDVDLAGLDRRAAAALRSALAADPWRRATPEAVCEDLARAAGEPDDAGTQVLRPSDGTGTTRAIGVGSGTRMLPAQGQAEPQLEPTAATATLPQAPAAQPVARPATYPPSPDTPPPPPGTWLPDGEPSAQPVVPGFGAEPPGPPRRPGTVLALTLPLLALAVAWPVAALAGGLVGAVGVRSIGLAAEGVRRRRRRRGPRAGDVLGGVVTWPWYLVRAVVGALPAVVSAVGVAAGLWLLARWALARWVVAVPAVGDADGVVPGNADWVGRAVCVAVVLVALGVAWFGPFAAVTRRGARWTLTVVGGGRAGAAALALVLIVAGALLAAVLVTHAVEWWPLQHVPGAG